MKTKNYLGKSLKMISALVITSLLLASCKKDFDNTPIEAAGIGFVHASPGTGPLDFVMDNQKGGTLNYTKDLGYYSAYPGIRTIGFAKKDSTKFLTYTNASLKSGVFYSAFAIDTLKSTKVLLVEDDLRSPDANKAKVRFINLSPDAPAYDLAIQGQSASLFSGKAFKEFTPFTAIDPSESYTFQLKETSSSAVKATLPAIKIEKGKIYTIWAKGLSSKTDSTGLGLSVMTNK